MRELDIIKLKKDLPKYGLKKGQIGAVVMTFGKPVKEIEAEFVDEKSGKTIAWIHLSVKDVELV